MSILASDFSTQVVIPALELLSGDIPYSKTAHDLLMGTAAQESLMGTYLVQQSGPGVGVFMMTPSEVPSLLARCSQKQLAALAQVSYPGEPVNQIISNLTFAAMIARLFYWQVPAALPVDTRSGLWTYYKRYYNTEAGAATESQWNTNFGLTEIDIPA